VGPIGIKGLLKLCGDAGVGRYFVWISLDPQIEAVRRWPADVGIRRRRCVAYLTLARDARSKRWPQQDSTSARCCVLSRNWAYLGMALTDEPFRRRGAYSALIAERIKKAVEVGCKIAVSETLSVAQHSLGQPAKGRLRGGLREGGVWPVRGQ
jgi:GNAT superfamily N-acetyltransferase